MKLLKKFTDYLLYNNLLIAIGAFVISYTTILYFSPQPNTKVQFHLAGFVACSTLFSYTLHRIQDVKNNTEQAYNNVLDWSIKNKFNIYLIFIISLVGIYYFLLHPHHYYSTEYTNRLILSDTNQKLNILILMPIFGLITLLYSIPLTIGKLEINIRKIPFAKILFIALVWAFATAYYPISFFNYHLKIEHWLFIIERFLFIVAITIPFDIRDTYADKKAGITTFSTSYGTLKSLQIATTICLFLLLMSVLQTNYYNIFFYSLLIPIIRIAHKPQHEYYYLGVLDGTIIIYGILMGVRLYLAA